MRNTALRSAAGLSYYVGMTSMNLFRFVQRFRRLPPDQQVAVYRLVDSLSEASRSARIVDAASELSEPAFAAVWDNDEDADYDRL